MDSLECSSYFFDLLNDLAEGSNIALCLLLNNTRRETDLVGRVTQNTQDNGIRKSVNDAIFKVCMSLERKIFTASTQTCEHFLNVDLDAGIFTDKILITPVLSKTGCSKKATPVSYSDADIQKIKAADLDLILRGNAKGIFQGDILSATRKGIISFHRIDNQWNHGDSLGFYEVYFKRPATGFVIQILNEKHAEGGIIFRGEIATKPLYACNLANLYQVASHFMAQVVRDYAETGYLPPFSQKGTYFSTPLEIPEFTTTLNYFIQTYPAIASSYLKQWILRRHTRWSVAYIMSDWMSANSPKVVTIKNPKRRFFADPFVVTRANGTAIFVEDYHYSNRRGTVSAIMILPDGSYKLVSNIIEEEFHLSFPYVFEHEGDLYMVPESYEAEAIRLYRCIQFPHKWEYLYDIMRGVSAVDTMVFEHSGRWWMLTNIAPSGTHEYWQLCAFSADSPLSKDWHPHPKNPVCFSVEFGRNGGILRDEGGAIYRVRQKQGFDMYGAAMSIAKIAKLDMDSYCEIPCYEIEPKFLPGLIGTHHMHSDGTFTVFDFVKEESLVA